ncbi:hypothetical protein YYG_04642 [Plasmodium vinckei petteri]|uniref:PIR protein CIR protein n=1 Tax=Plasmodium vinckei petteri TaxID=138298 RepID=W7AMQ6_PLAVN|nr:hypothetical protein YYG_04642 [Plasmodium vinckei petteri]
MLDVVIQKVMSEININSSTNEFCDECEKVYSNPEKNNLKNSLKDPRGISTINTVETGTPPSMPGNGTDTLGNKKNVVDGPQYKSGRFKHPANFYLDPSLSPAPPEPSQPQPSQTQYSSQNTIPNGEPNLLQSHDSNPGTGIPLTPINFNTNPSSTDNRSINSRTDIKMSENHQYGV